MSRGLGVMERAIAACIANCKRRDECDSFLADAGYDPSPRHVYVRAWDVCRTIDRETTPTEARLKAARRAMYSFVRKFPEYGLMIGKGRGKLCLYERNDRFSAMWAKLTSQAGRSVTSRDVVAALKHVDAKRNEPFRLKDEQPIHYFGKKDGSQMPTHHRAPSVFKDLDI